nr:ribonuclease H-like domain, reverse transcriptase, RNA-dependent DNA polymerase [Tanacetum cinerariifolium]
KFDGKADEGFFVGYSLNSQAFRVFNSLTRIVEETLHIMFSENTPNNVGSVPNWLFDIDTLTKTMNYQPVVAGTQSNGNVDQKEKDSVNSSNRVNVVSSTVNVVSNKVNVVGRESSIELLDDPYMPELEDISILEDLNEDVFDAKADLNNLESTFQMDVKSAFLYEKIEEDVYVFQPLGFEDPDFRNTSMETHKTLLKDEKGEDVDEHLYRSMIGSLMYLTSSRPDIMFAVPQDYNAFSAVQCLFIHFLYVIPCLYIRSLSVMLSRISFHVLYGRTPTLGFMRPFGCPVTILNTKDHLGKFDGKVNEGFFVGYSINSKAFRVFKSRTRIVKENLHVKFNENTSNIAGSGPNWLFDIDVLTKLINYKPVVVENQSIGNACTKACDDAGKARMEIVPGKDYILLSIEAIRLFLAYASLKDFVVYQIDVKSAFLYGKIEKDVYVCQTLRFEDPDFPDKVYKVEKVLYGLRQAPKAWHETLSTYLLDNGFHRGKIDKTLFIKRHKDDILLVQVYVDDIIFDFTKKELCNAFEKMMYDKFQMSSMGEHTFFPGLQVKEKQDGIFISQDKYVAEILKKYGFLEVKNASTLMETQKPLLKDKDIKEVDFHIDYAGASLDRKSRTRGCPRQCKKQTVVANSTIEAEYVATSSCYGKVLWIQNQLLDYGVGKDFSGRVTPLFPTMMVQAQEEMGVDEAVNEGMDDRLVRAATTASSLEAEQDSGNIAKIQSKETPTKSSSQRTDLGGVSGAKTPWGMLLLRLGKEDASIQGRITDHLDVDEDITLVNDQEMFDVIAFATTITIDDITLAKALEALKTSKPKIRGIVKKDHEEPSESRTTTTISLKKLQEKGKDKMIEELVKLKKNDQSCLMKKLLENYKKINKEEILVGERARQEEEANIALLETWEVIQAKRKRECSLMLRVLKKRGIDHPKKLNKDLFDKAMKRVNTFVDYTTELVEESSKKVKAEITQEKSSKRAGDEMEQETAKKQKIVDDKETENLKQLVKIILE